MASEIVDTKVRAPQKVTGSPANRGSPPSTKKKKGVRSPTTIGILLRKRNLMARLGSPRNSGVGYGQRELKSCQLGPSLSVDRKKSPRGSNTQDKQLQPFK
ncbi:unnamed protein product [Eruca vesicaria subsp. sativa]|uniref:Uncharacterized protein n=1 Tax=Eruca vesicaria subsp. sativa TaxID=29727 RepID=A0ABC8JT83_ERUVS|nr:unnamed protein product [Eruca vesicaria subsp. sativa]